MLFNVPIEPLDQRYTAQWLRWFTAEFSRLGVPCRHIYPNDMEAYSRIRSGQFLDVVRTNTWKAKQLALICDLFDISFIAENDVFLVHDLWFPGIEMLFYIRDGLGLKFKIAGIFHAGTYDPHDYLTQRGMERWAAPLEQSWINEVDVLFLATDFHHRLIEPRLNRSAKVEISGLPIMSREFFPYLALGEPRDNIVVFPHRLAPEKQPEVFEHLQEETSDSLPGWRFVYTQDKRRDKDEYCRLLARSKVAVSTALQETWGIGMQEAVYLGCIPLVPNRLAYARVYPHKCVYNSHTHLAERTVWAAKNYDRIVCEKWFVDWRDWLIHYNDGAIERMVISMRDKGWSV